MVTSAGVCKWLRASNGCQLYFQLIIVSEWGSTHYLNKDNQERKLAAFFAVQRFTNLGPDSMPHSNCSKTKGLMLSFLLETAAELILKWKLEATKCRHLVDPIHRWSMKMALAPDSGNEDRKNHHSKLKPGKKSENGRWDQQPANVTPYHGK